MHQGRRVPHRLQVRSPDRSSRLQPDSRSDQVRECPDRRWRGTPHADRARRRSHDAQGAHNACSGRGTAPHPSRPAHRCADVQSCVRQRRPQAHDACALRLSSKQWHRSGSCVHPPGQALRLSVCRDRLCGCALRRLQCGRSRQAQLPAGRAPPAQRACRPWGTQMPSSICMWPIAQRIAGEASGDEPTYCTK